MATSSPAGKAWILCILNILKEKADKEHPLSLPIIHRIMEKEYGYKSTYDSFRQIATEDIAEIERLYGVRCGEYDTGRKDKRGNTVYEKCKVNKDSYFVNFLKSVVGMSETEIRKTRNGVQGYYFAPELELEEILLLMECIYSARFISANDAKALIAKLQNNLSICQKQKYNNKKEIKAYTHTINQNLIKNFSIINDAIVQKKQISFSYMEYDANGRDVKREKGDVKASPYGFSSENDAFYLIMHRESNDASKEYDGLSKYRLDFIQDVKILQEKVARRDQWVTETVITPFAFVGTLKSITMLVEKDCLKYVRDTFTNNIKITDLGDKYKVVVRSTVEGTKYWALQFIGKVEVLEPVSLREDIINTIKNCSYLKP